MHVIINLAPKQPLPSGHGNHCCSDSSGRKYTENISTMTLVEQGMAIEVDGMKIYVITNTKKMPRHRASETHFQCWQVTINKTIYCWGKKRKHRQRSEPVELIVKPLSFYYIVTFT